MTMSKARTIPAGQFKTRCLALLDQVERTGTPIVVTKRGRRVAQVVRVEQPAAAKLRGSVTFHGDIVGSLLGEWEVER
jgi:prevent-host-death family protein